MLGPQTSIKKVQKTEIIWELIVHYLRIWRCCFQYSNRWHGLIAVSAAPLLIQGWMSHKNLDLKIQNCTYAHQSYKHLLNEIKDMMRSGNFNSSHIYNTMKNIDDYVTDNGPIVDKYLIKYDKKFTH